MSPLNRAFPSGADRSMLGSERLRRSLPRTRRGILAAFAACAGALAYWQLVRGHDLLSVPSNVRGTPLRGRILARDGAPLAWSERHRRFGYVRKYSEISLAQVIGYAGGAGAGIEAAYAEHLVPRRRQESFLPFASDVGRDVVLGIDVDLQRHAARLLGGTEGRASIARGCILAVDLTSGTVLASVSSPTYDPRPFVNPLGGIRDAYDTLRNDPSAPLMNRPTEALYQPGCAFLPIIAAAILESGLDVSERVIVPTVFREDPWWSGPAKSGTAAFTLASALQHLARGYFAAQGLRLGAERLDEMITRFGFGQGPGTDLPASAGQVSSRGTLITLRILIDTARGQGELLVSLIQVVNAFAAIARGGTLLPARYVREIRHAEGRLVDASPDPDRSSGDRRTREVLGREAAARLHSLLGRIAISGSDAVAVEGPSESALGLPHDWFIGYAPARQPKVIVGVVREHAGAVGGSGEIGRSFLSRALERATSA